MGIFKHQKIQLLIIVLVTVLVYSNIFQNEFILDDTPTITNSAVNNTFENIPKFLTYNSVPEGFIAYRPVRAVLNILYFQLWGPNTWFYHLSSLIVHLCSTILIYFITKHFTLGVKKQQFHLRSRKYLAFITALLFGLHPIHTESITFITSSLDTTGYLFLFSSFYCYLKSAGKIQKHYFFSIFFAFLAIFTLETTIILPLLIIFYDFILRKTKIKKFIQIYIPYFLTIFLYLFIRTILLKIGARGDYLGESFYHTMLTMVKAHLKYIELLIFPLNLTMDQPLGNGIWSHLDNMKNFNKILSQSIFDLPILTGIVVLLGIGFAAIKSFKKLPLITFGIGWFFISLLPASYLIPQGPIMQERYIYSASFGFVLFLGYLISKGLYSKRFKSVTLVFFMTILLFYGIRTYIRNFNYRDHRSLWTDMADRFPTDPQANYTVAGYYLNKDNIRAVYYYKRAVQAEPQVALLYLNLAETLLKIGDSNGAKVNFRKALELEPGNFNANLGLNKMGIKTGKNDWLQYRFKNLIFYYPEALQISTDKNGIRLVSEKIQILISNEKLGKQTAEEFIQNYALKDIRAKKGIANIPNFDQSLVWILDDDNRQKIQLLLFKGNEAFVLIFTGDKESLETLNNIIETLRIENQQDIQK